MTGLFKAGFLLMQLLFYCPKFLLVLSPLRKELFQYRDWSLHRIFFPYSQASIKSLQQTVSAAPTAAVPSLSSAITFLYKYAA